MDFLKLYLRSQTYKVLLSDQKANMLSHCYLISSKDKIMLDEIGMYAVKQICCLQEDKPCNVCVNCSKIEHGNMVDLEIYPKDDKSLMVDDILKVIDSAYIRPMENTFKIFLLKNFDECTIQGQNKILKTLEEPPANVIFFLTVQNIGNVLPTILSRSKRIEEGGIPIDIISQFLKSQNVLDAELIASMSDGLMTTALKIAENKDAREIINLALHLCENFNSTKDLLYFSSQILALKKDIPFFLDTLTAMLRDIAVCESSQNLLFKNLKDKFISLSKVYTSQIIEKIILLINQVALKLEVNCNMTGVIDKLLLDILEVKFLCQK